MRIALAAFAFAFATSAAAQTLPPLGGHTPLTAVSPEIAGASHALAAIWRPLTGPATEAGLTAACVGSVEDMRTLDAAIPETPTAASLGAIHPAHGIVFVPDADNPAAIFIFPSADMAWLTSGQGTIGTANEATGEVALRDAGDHTMLLTLGHAAGHSMLRLTVPNGSPVTYVGCAATVN